MKIKVVLASVAVVAIAVVAFAFVKPTTTATFYFDNSVGLKRGPINGTSQLIMNEVTTTTNWVPTAQVSAPGLYLNAISFDQEAGDVSNGISDGHYSLQEAVTAVWNEYTRSNQFMLPANGSSFTPAGTTSPITIERAASN